MEKFIENPMRFGPIDTNLALVNKLHSTASPFLEAIKLQSIHGGFMNAKYEFSREDFWKRGLQAGITHENPMEDFRNASWF